MVAVSLKNPVATALAERLGHPLLSTSIPQSEDGMDAQAIAHIYENTAALLIDAGESDGIPSTVVDLTDSRSPEIIREGKGELK